MGYWKIIGKLEARELKETLDMDRNYVAALIESLKKTSRALYQVEKESEASADRESFV